jgi:benzoyl-CoA reductase/2-hydroxyglutaryl-CoA dehydratase subunit BcrC/BadD/HgdB
MEKRGVPVLTLESDYGTSDLGQLKTRVDAFIELLKGGKK